MLTGLGIGLALGVVFLLGGLVVREIPAVAERVTRVLEYTNHGNLALLVVITLVNGFAENCSSGARCTPRWAPSIRC